MNSELPSWDRAQPVVPLHEGILRIEHRAPELGNERETGITREGYIASIGEWTAILKPEYDRTYDVLTDMFIISRKPPRFPKPSDEDLALTTGDLDDTDWLDVALCRLLSGLKSRAHYHADQPKYQELRPGHLFNLQQLDLRRTYEVKQAGMFFYVDSPSVRDLRKRLVVTVDAIREELNAAREIVTLPQAVPNGVEETRFGESGGLGMRYVRVRDRHRWAVRFDVLYAQIA